MLGSAAGGGFPQWNCVCAGCRAARDDSGRARRRSESALAIRADEGPWYLVNASPDVRHQLERLPFAGAASRTRRAPFEGVVLTDAELDHVLGLLTLREADEPLRLFGSPAVREALSRSLPVLPLLGRWCGISWTDLDPGRPTELDGGLRIEPFPAGSGAPRYVRGSLDGTPVLGLTFVADGGSLTYTPGLERLDREVIERLRSSDCALVDGTCWYDDDLERAGAGARRARDMGHVPLAGPEGSLGTLAALSRTRVVLVHVNNTNPVLLEDSPERRQLDAAGVEVAEDGLVLQVPA